MDEDDGNALEEFSTELEEHLYSKIHHGQIESEEVRNVVSQTIAAGGQKGKNGRYFGSGKPPPPWIKKFGNRKPVLGIDKAPSPQRGKDGQKFTPYQSFLQGIKLCSQAVQKKQMRKNPMAFRKPDDVPESDAAKIQEAPKNTKKKKNRGREKKKLQTVVLDSGEGEKDDVVEIPVPPPPLVCLDSSDESMREGVELPKKPQGGTTKRRISPRGSSPSSSILSDDFIAAKDRRRLAEAQIANFVADDELGGVQQSGSPMKRLRTNEGTPKAKLSDISTSDSEDFLPDGETTSNQRYQARKQHPPSPKALPYIHRGEALPNATSRRTMRKSIDAALSTPNRSDEEFITMLSSIAHGGDTSNSQAASNSDDDVELVRECAEVESGDIVINIDGNVDDREKSEVSKVPEKSQWVEEETETEREDEEGEEIAEKGAEQQGEEDAELNDYPPFLLHGWNEEMRRFYEESWGDEKFSVQNIIRQMPDNNQWQINAKDLNFSRFHRSWREAQEMKLVCYMCGQSGHREPRCPNTLCLKCGNRAMVFGIACSKCSDWPASACDICHTKGHKAELCPDSWRRYHTTVDDKAPDGEEVSVNPRKFCSICARSGHLADSCPCPVRILEYPTSPWTISSYEGVYDVPEDTKNSADPFHTYRGANVDFKWSDTVKNSQFYGRFLSYCGVKAEKNDPKEASSEEENQQSGEEAREIQKDNSEAKIFLHRDFCQSLLSPRGQLVMKSMADEMSVEVNLRTSGHGNLLKLRGEHKNVESFKQHLMRFLTSLSKRTPEEQEMDYMHFPRDRSKLIQFMRGKMRQLTNYIGSAPNLYSEMRQQENPRRGKTINRQKMADRTRSLLNMILMGQAGLREGRMHLRALEADLAMLEKHHQDGEVPQIMRNSIFVHFRYIFTPFRHGNYEDLLRQFHSMRNTNKLPTIAIPRQTNHQRRKKPRYLKNNSP